MIFGFITCTYSVVTAIQSIVLTMMCYYSQVSQSSSSHQLFWFLAIILYESATRMKRISQPVNFQL